MYLLYIYYPYIIHGLHATRVKMKKISPSPLCSTFQLSTDTHLHLFYSLVFHPPSVHNIVYSVEFYDALSCMHVCKG